jgi:hypothetical protein
MILSEKSAAFRDQAPLFGRMILSEKSATFRDHAALVTPWCRFSSSMTAASSAAIFI